MTIGRQFENTFWEDPNTGETHTWTRGTYPDGTQSTKPLHQIGASNEQLGVGPQGLQGLLFHPLTGTGLKDDPMIPAEMRRGTIQKALDLTNPAKYIKNLGAMLQNVQRSEISERVATNHIRRLTDTLDNSDMPTQVIAKRSGDAIGLDPTIKSKPIRAVLDPIEGRAWAESSGNGIRMTSPSGSATVRVTTKELVNVPSETPIGNHKFWEQLTKARNKVSSGDSHNSISADSAFELATHWVHPKTGHVLTKQQAENLPVDYSSDPPGEDVENSLDTPALVLKTMGYVPNLFPGKGNETAKSHSIGTHGKIETGYGDYDRGTDYTYSKFHTRFTPGTQEERDVTTNVRRDVPLKESTMTHELGHAMDPGMGNDVSNRGSYTFNGPIDHFVTPNNKVIIGLRSISRLKKRFPDTWKNYEAVRQTKTVGADPMEEGIADASADRYTRYKGQFGDALANPERRIQDSKSSGYTTDYSGWKNKTQKALYLATRYHTALADNLSQPQQIPTRRQIIKALPETEQKNIDKLRFTSDGRPAFGGAGSNAYLDTANSLALGHIYHHMPHVRDVLKQAGFEKAALDAHVDYKKRMGLDIEHPTLPGMEDFV